MEDGTSLGKLFWDVSRPLRGSRDEEWRGQVREERGGRKILSTFSIERPCFSISQCAYSVDAMVTKLCGPLKSSPGGMSH